ncbi:TPA: glycosyltransferase family 2 protein, partial [Enterococcus faecium]
MMVSVVIPTFQRNDFLERAINSVFKQNFTDYEILIIDDNVGENVYRINNRNLENKIQNSKIRFIYNEKNLGGA